VKNPVFSNQFPRNLAVIPNPQPLTTQNTTENHLKSIIGLFLRKHAKRQQVLVTLHRISGAAVPRSVPTTRNDFLEFGNYGQFTIILHNSATFEEISIFFSGKMTFATIQNRRIRRVGCNLVISRRSGTWPCGTS
jgi:hypothetical protein